MHVDISTTYKRLVQRGKEATNRLIGGGAETTEDLTEQSRIKLTNGISFILAVTSVIFGWIYFWVVGRIDFVIATHIETAIFSYIIYLNHHKRTLLAGILLQGLITVAVMYFGILFGKALEIYVLAV